MQASDSWLAEEFAVGQAFIRLSFASDRRDFADAAMNPVCVVIISEFCKQVSQVIFTQYDVLI